MAIFGIVDAAQDEKIYPLVIAAREHVCLFAGDLDPAIARAAPYLVLIDEDSELMSKWRDVGWAENWGILCKSRASLKDMRKHLRKFLQVMLPDGDIVLFRFYDPRVWNTYISTCNSEELGKWFDKVEEFRAPTSDGQGATHYMFQNNELVVQTSY